MSTFLLVNTAFLFGLLLGVRRYGRWRYNAGVADGRRSERLEHGWRDDPHLSVRVPRQRRWRVLNRQQVDEPLVFRVVTAPAQVLRDR